MPKNSTRRGGKGAAGASAPTRVSLSSRYSESTALPDYSYVKNDLKRIGILAGSMFAGMIILNFILPYILPLYAR